MVLAKSGPAVIRTIRRFFSELKTFGFFHAVNGLMWDVFQHFSFYGVLTEYFYKKRGEYVFDYIKTLPILEKYDERIKQKIITKSQVHVFRIWFFWWQGMENAPELVQICYKSVCKHNPDSVCIVTGENLKSFVKIPEYIEKKRSEGKISFQHYADIVRVTLLARYGGLWLDATCFVTTNMPEIVKRSVLYTVKQRYFKQHFGEIWMIGSSAEDMILFAFMRDVWFSFWRDKDTVIDYFFMNRMFEFAYNRWDAVRELYDNAPYSTENKIRLIDVFNLPYKETLWNDIVASAWLYKLSYKGNFIVKTQDGCETFYGHFLHMYKF